MTKSKTKKNAVLDKSKLNTATLANALGMLGHACNESEVIANPEPFVNALGRQVIAAKQFMRSVGDASAALQVAQAKAALFDRLFAIARRDEPYLTVDELMAKLLKNLDEAEADHESTAQAA